VIARPTTIRRIQPARQTGLGTDLGPKLIKYVANPTVF